MNGNGKTVGKAKNKKSEKGKRFLQEIPTMERPREKMLKRGTKALSNLELIVALLGCGIKGRDVLQVAEDVVNVTEKNFDRLSVKKLESVSGVGTARACQILAAIEFSRRFLIKEGIKVKTDRDVLNLVTDLSHKKQECFLTLTLDGDRTLIRKRMLFKGTLNESLIHPREIFAEALTDRAAGIIFVHNHPSGNSSPSDKDDHVTERLWKAGKIMGIEILDHIIVGKYDYYSYKKCGYFKEKERLPSFP